MDIEEILCEFIDWINMAQDTDKLRFVDKYSNYSGFYKMKISAWPAEKLAACEG